MLDIYVFMTIGNMCWICYIGHIYIYIYMFDFLWKWIDIRKNKIKWGNIGTLPSASQWQRSLPLASRWQSAYIASFNFVFSYINSFSQKIKHIYVYIYMTNIAYSTHITNSHEHIYIQHMLPIVASFIRTYT